MDGRPTMTDNQYLEKLEKLCKAGDLIAHRLSEINGTLGRIEFHITQEDNTGKEYVSLETAAEMLKDCNFPKPLEVVDDP